MERNRTMDLGRRKGPYVKTSISKNGLKRDQNRMVYFVLGPALAYFALVTLFPMLYAFGGSFCEWKFMDGVFRFAGFSNYQRLFTEPRFWEAIGRTVAAAAGIVLGRTALGLIIAVLIYAAPRFRSFFRTAYFLPVITSVVAVSLLWRYLYEPGFGLFNMVLGALHLPKQAWLKSEVLVMPCIMLMTIWKDLGYAVVLYLAGLSGIPASLYEAALIDGANRVQIFRKITLPFLQNVTLFIVATSFISYMQMFTEVYLMTSTGGSSNAAGGPGFSSNTVVFYLWTYAFRNYDFGLGAAIALTLFAVIFAITIVQTRLMKTDWGY